MKLIRLIAFFSIAAAVASATSVTFTFTGLAENSTAAQIQNYMNGVLATAGCTGCTVTVTGAFADTTYGSTGHTTGPGNGGSGGTAAKSLTLGNSENATASNFTSPINTSYDTFLATTNDAGSSSDSQITIQFSGLTVNGAASTDYQVFPSSNCTDLKNSACGGNKSNGIYPDQPRLTFDTNGSTPVSTFGTNGTQYSTAPGNGNGNTKNSTLSTSESSPQYIGTWSGSLSNVTELDFIAWSSTIGVDNLMINFTPTTVGDPVPEPVSVTLLGTVIAGLGLRYKLRKKTA